MPRGWEHPETIIAEIDVKVNRLKEKAFPHNGRLHFYSGPSKDVADLIVRPHDNNHVRAIAWAKAHGAMIIDDSPIGKFLDTYRNLGTFNYFRNNPLYPDSKDKVTAALLPWKHASHLVALSAHGHLTTTVCGADRSGVYYAIEMPNVLSPTYHGLSASEFLAALSTPRKKDVETINLIPFSQILDIRDNKGIDAAQVTIQRGEIRMSMHEALEKAEPDVIRAALKLASKEVLRSPADAYKYFLESQERFLVDRALQMKGTLAANDFFANKTPVVRAARREKRLQRFASEVLLLIETEIALMPDADRPDFIVPAYVKTRAPR